MTLTSNYDTASDGATANVRVIARGDCTSLTGAGTTTFCAVGLNVASRLELVTVRSTAGASSGHAVLTTSTLPPTGGAPPRILDANAENAPESAIRVYGSVSVGPRVNATNSAQGSTRGGLSRSRGRSSTCSTPPPSAVRRRTRSPTTGATASARSATGSSRLKARRRRATRTPASSSARPTSRPPRRPTTSRTSRRRSTGCMAGRLVAPARSGSGLARSPIGSTPTGNTDRAQRRRHHRQRAADPRSRSSRPSSGYAVGHEAIRNGSGGVLLNQASPPATAPSSSRRRT